MKTRLLIIVLVFVGVFGTAYADSDPNDDYRKFPLGNSYMYADSKHITDISISWSESLPYGTITFDKRIDSDISIMIPKNIPRMMNLDFGTSMAVFYSDTSVEQIKETETDCFYHLRIHVNNEDEISIDTITVATGRWEPVTIDEPKCDGIYKHYSETYELKADTSFSNIPPLKQFKSGIPIDEIQCKDDLVLLQKYDDSPACVYEKSILKLVQREWGTSENWIKVSNANNVIHYNLDNATLTDILAFSEYKNPSLPGETKQTQLQINLESTQDGSMQITLPRNLIDSKINNADDDFFVLLDGTETEYQETKTESVRTLNFSIPAKTDVVEIIGYGYYNSELEIQNEN